MGPDTIVAVATPRGSALRGVIRISGPDALSLTESLFTPAPGFPLGAHLAPGVTQGALRVGRSRVHVQADVWVWRAPRSFTGEDVVEIHLPGSPLLLAVVQDLVIHGGGRGAEPGEFTRRAFLNGRIDLTRAEAVLAMTRARDDGERREAINALRGALARRLAVVRDRVLRVLVPLELAMDFSDQDVDVPIPADAPRDLEVAATELHGLASASRGVAVRRSAFRVVLTGPPNAGKSSLFNRLLGEEAALVSPVPGTTRDVLCGEIVSGGVHVELVDTAGVGVTREAADRMAHGQRRRSLREADLVLQVRDVRDAASVNQRRRPGHVLRVLTHVDLLNGAGPPPEALCMSNLTGFGVESVWDAVLARLATLDGENESVCVSARQGAAFRQAAASLFHAAGALSRGVDAELIASDLRASLHHIGEVTGERVSDAVLDRVFSEFCIGK